MKNKPPPDPKQVTARWGLPDWQDAKQYPDHRAVAIDRWCWEFLRRSQEYRTFWREEVSPLLQRRAALPQQVERLVAGQMDEQEARAVRLEILDLPSDEARPLIERLGGGQTPAGPMPEECLPGGGTRFMMTETMQRFGLFHAIDPRKSEQVQPAFAAGITELHAGTVDQDPHKVTVEFDTRLPDKQQLDLAKRILSIRRRTLELRSLPEQKQRERFDAIVSGPKIRSPEARARPERYRDYLRVLDAKNRPQANKRLRKFSFQNSISTAV